MDITWYGHSCFRMTERGHTSVMTDPFSEALGLAVPRWKADVVTVSHDAPGHSAVDLVKNVQYTLRGPGEYEIGGVFLTGIAMHHFEPSTQTARPNVAYLISYETNLTVLHLGDLAHVPPQSVVEEIGEVSVLLVPVGGGNSLKASQAAELVALIEPSYIVPMHYALPGVTLDLDPVDKFLKEMGVSKVQEETTLKIAASNLPEQPQVVVLTPQTA